MFRGADLSALVREACVNALRVHLSSQPAQTHTGNTHTRQHLVTNTTGDPHRTQQHVFNVTEPEEGIRVSRIHFEDAFKKVRPSVSKKVSDENIILVGLNQPHPTRLVKVMTHICDCALIQL